VPRLVSLIIMTVLLLTACAGPASDVKFVELYRVSCAGCHGADLSGGIGSPVGPGSNSAENLTDDQLWGAIAVGPGAMPGFGGSLTAAQIDSLVDYLRSEQGP